jgi:hypothetical protein
LGSEVAVLVEEIDLEDLLAIWRVSISEDEGDEEGENGSEGAVTDVGGEDVVVIGVEELTRWIGTSREVIPPA